MNDSVHNTWVGDCRLHIAYNQRKYDTDQRAVHVIGTFVEDDKEARPDPRNQTIVTVTQRYHNIITYIEAAIGRLGCERGGNVTNNYGLEINDRAPISGPHKNSDWTDNTHNRKHGIGGPESILGSQSKRQSPRPVTEVILRQRLISGLTSLEPTWQPGKIIERRQGCLM